MTTEQERAELRKLSESKQALLDNIPGLASDESAFVRWAGKEKYDLSCHPMFFVMLDSKTYAARMGWKAARDQYETVSAAKTLELLDDLGRQEAEIARLTAEIANVKEVEFPRKCQAVADGWKAKVDRLTAALAQQVALVEKCMVEMNANADRGEKAEAERDSYKADAERYRVIRDSEWEMLTDSWLNEKGIYGDGPDELDGVLDGMKGQS